MTDRMFSPARVFVVIVLVAITAWYLGARNATPHGVDRTRQEQPFPHTAIRTVP